MDNFTCKYLRLSNELLLKGVASMQEESTTRLCNSSYPKLMCNVTDIYDS